MGTLNLPVTIPNTKSRKCKKAKENSGPDRKQRPPPPARAAKIMESRSYDSAKPYLPCRYGSLWTCENCGDSGMTTFVRQCPQCQHSLCENCDEYSRNGFSYREPPIEVTHRHDILKKNSVSIVLPPQNSPKDPLSSRCLAYAHPLPKTVLTVAHKPQISAMSEQDGQGFASPTADEGITPPLSAETPDLIMASDIGLSSSYSTPSSEVILTPTSTQESNISSGTFSVQVYMISETELETDDTESTEDATDDEDPLEAFDYAIDILDSRLFSILGHDLELASRLIPQIHAQLQLGFRTESGVYTASPSHGPSGAPETYGDSSVSTSTSSNGSSHNGSPGHKRGRERGESKDRGDKSGSKRPRRSRDRSAESRRRYACHFNKKDPARYCSLTNPKFNTCLGRGNPQLRRMKEHYLKAHRPSQCERCYTIFKDHDELKDHRKAESPCHNQSDVLKEGIDDSQWAKIEPLFHVQRKLSPCQKKLDDYDKWFEIWNILFPNISKPLDPWVDLVPVFLSALPNDVEGLITNFNSLIEHDIEQGVLQRDDKIHQRYERAFRVSLQTHAAVSAPAVSFDHSFIEINEHGNSSTEHPSERQTTLETLETSLRELASSQPTPQHLPRPYQDHISPRLDAQSVPPFLGQFDVLEGTHILQPSNESVSQMFDVPNTSNVFESPLELRGTSTTQQHLAVSSPTYFQSEANSFGQQPIEYPVASNTEQTQDPLRHLGGSNLGSSQEDFMPSDNHNFEFNEAELNSDSLTKMLEFENDDPASFAAW